MMQRSINTTITGGDIPTPELFPWLVSIGRLRVGAVKAADLVNAHQGGGVALDPEWVLTAAHPFRLLPFKNGSLDLSDIEMMVVRAHDLLSPNQLHPVVEVRRHPDYRDGELDNDLALVRVKRADLPSHVALLASDPEPGRCATIMGWGFPGLGEGKSSVRRFANVAIRDRDTCSMQSLEGHPANPSNMICAGGADSHCPQPIGAACGFDSGGPLVIAADGEQATAGVLIFSALVCQVDEVPDVFMRVSRFIPWIRENVPNARVMPKL